MAYTLTEDNCVIRATDGALIPNDPANRDYAEYQEWLKAGNTPTPYTPPAPAPVKSLTPKEKLERAGLSLDEFAQLINEAQSIIKHDPPPDKERGV
jgi:hypothetical protein